MYAVIETGGKQYIVRENEVIQVEKLTADPGGEVRFDSVLLVSDEKGDVKIGTPLLSGVTVLAEALEEFKGKKVVVGKFKRRKNYRRKKGHRQAYTSVKIKSIKI